MEHDKQEINTKLVDNSEQRISFCKGLFSYYTDRIFCDVSLSTNNGQPDGTPEIIECHKLALSSASEFFSKQLIVDESKPECNIIDVSPVKIEILKEVLCYIYTGKCNISKDNATSLLQIGVEWNLVHLVNDCKTAIEEMISVENAAHFIQQAHQLKQDKLVNVCSAFIRGHFAEVCETPGMNQLNIEVMKELLSSDQINVQSEDSIFKAVTNFLEANPAVNDPDLLFQLIRYDHLTKEFFCESVLCHPQMHLLLQAQYLSNAIKNRMDASNRKIISTRPRYWGASQYVMLDKDQHVVVFSRSTKNWQEHSDAGKFPWKVNRSTTCVTQDCLFMAGSSEVKDHMKVSAIGILNNTQFLNNTHQPVLRELPHDVHNCGLISDCDHLYVISGVYQGNTTKRVIRIDINDPVADWNSMTKIPNYNQSPIAVKVRQFIHVIGGLSYTTQHQCYNIDTNTWEQKAAAPQSCNAQTSGGFDKEDIIYVFTTTMCMTYDTESKQWNTAQYNSIGKSVKPVLYDGKIVACVQQSNNTFVLMRYNREKNIWTEEDVDVSRCLGTQHFHVFERPSSFNH